jgi:hypothetical protein
MRTFCRLAVALSIVTACGRNSQPRAAVDSRTRGTIAQLPATAAATGSCAPTGQWSECAVFDRLDHAGLAPRRDSTAGSTELPPLNQRGTRLLLGGSELDVFIYPDAATRQQDENHLDRSKFIEATDEPTLRGEATIIRSANLLAILRSRNDHQRERVSDALSAGPPQAGKGAPLPGTRTPK